MCQAHTCSELVGIDVEPNLACPLHSFSFVMYISEVHSLFDVYHTHIGLLNWYLSLSCV